MDDLLFCRQFENLQTMISKVAFLNAEAKIEKYVVEGFTWCI